MAAPRRSLVYKKPRDTQLAARGECSYYVIHITAHLPECRPRGFPRRPRGGKGKRVFSLLLGRGLASTVMAATF